MFVSSKSILESLPEPDNMIDSLILRIDYIKYPSLKSEFDINIVALSCQLHPTCIRSSEENIDHAIDSDKIDEKMSCCWESM